jgi:hypothetical protein
MASELGCTGFFRNLYRFTPELVGARAAHPAIWLIKEEIEGSTADDADRGILLRWIVWARSG